MATTSRIAATVLQTGQSAESAAFTNKKQMTLTATCTKRGSEALRLRVFVRDSEGRPAGGIGGGALNFDESGTLRMTVNAVPSPATVYAECISGEASITVVEEIGSAEEIELADLPAGLLTADATGRAKMADDFVNAAKILAAAVTTAKLGPAAVTGPKLDLSGLKFLSGDGVDASSGDAQATFTGTAIGDRVVALIGQTKAADGNAQASLNAWDILVGGTGTEAAVTVTNKIIIKQVSGNKAAIAYFAVLAPAAA